MTETNTEVGSAKHVFSWRSLLVWAAVGDLAFIIIIEALVRDVIPPLLAGAVLIPIGLILLTRKTRAGLIYTGIVMLLLGVAVAPDVLFRNGQPSAGLEFGATWLATLSTLVGLISAIAAFATEGKDTPSMSKGPKFLGAIFALAVAATLALGFFSVERFVSQTSEPGDLEVTANDTTYLPPLLTATGGTVSVFVRNNDPYVHTFTIDKAGIDIVIPGGKSVRAVFNGEPGEYHFHCKIPHHEAMSGMITLTTR